MIRFAFAGLVLLASLFAPGNAMAALPSGEDLVSGGAEFTSSLDDLTLTVQQTTDRAVINWDRFDIGLGAHVDFKQPGVGASILNIVTGATSSLLAGRLTADGSVFLINPHGITVTEDGQIDTGGAFVASTLHAVSITDFMNGSNTLAFHVPDGSHAGDVRSEGVITAQDVLLLGSRVENTGTITARLGRIALGSASHATLDLTGDGFLQVLAPADVAGDDALITNSGTLLADGGLVELKASTVYEAMREAVYMDGTVRARSVEGRDGAIVFSGGDGGTLAVSGTVDASPDGTQGGTGGGSIRLEGTVVDLDFDGVHLGARGHFSLAADDIDIIGDGGYKNPNATVIVEGLSQSSIGDLLRAGVNVTLHGNESLRWEDGLLMSENQLSPDAGGKAGDLHLLAGQRIELGGRFRTVNSDWTLTVNARPVSGIQLGEGAAYIDMFTYVDGVNWARFVDHNGRLTVEILGGDESAGLAAGSISTPAQFSGEALTARIAHDALGYDTADIQIRGDIEVADTITLSGHVRTVRQEGSAVTTLSGRTVTWTTEKTDRLAGGLLQFVEDGVVTRFGRGGSGPTALGVDATRLVLGSTTSVHRIYGDADPEVGSLWDLVLNLAAHNAIAPGQGFQYFGSPLEGIPEGGIPLTEILAPGSIEMVGPGATADANAAAGFPHYYLMLRASNELAFKSLEVDEYEDDIGLRATYISGAAGGYWIDLSEESETAARIPLVIEPRSVTVEVINPTYEYGSPELLVRLHNVVNDDVLTPVGTLQPVGESETENITFAAIGNGFGLADARTLPGAYAYAVSGMLGERAGNYTLNLSGVPVGTLNITPRTLGGFVPSLTRNYGTPHLPAAELYRVLGGDDVRPVIEIAVNGESVANSERLPVGHYVVRMIGLTGEDADKYTVFGVTDGSLQVQPIQVTWSLADATSVYGTLATFDVTLHGVLEGDDVGGNVALRDSTQPLSARTNVANYVTIVDSLTGADRGNYTLLTDWSNPSNRPGWLFIRPKELSLDATPLSFVYGDTSGGRLLGGMPLPQLTGRLPGDEVSLKPWYVQSVRVGESHGPSGADVGVGEYQLVIGTDESNWAPLEGQHHHNYVLPNVAYEPISVTVTPRPINAAVQDKLSVYGTEIYPAVTFDGVLGGDQVLGQVTLWQGDNPLEFDSRLSVGLYTMSVTGLSGDAAANYTLNAEGLRRGSLVIQPKVLQFTSPVTIVYGDELRFDASLQHGVLAGDQVRVDAIARSPEGTPIWNPAVGTYEGLASHLTGPDARNYALPAQESERVFSGLNISKRPITAHVVDRSPRRYGDPVHAVLEFKNYVPGNPVLDYSHVNYWVSNNPDESPFQPLFERTAVGTYSLRITGFEHPNYILADENVGLLEILPKSLRYTTFDQEIVYGAVNPVFFGGAFAVLREEDIVPGDVVFVGDVGVANRELYPEGRLSSGNKYPLAVVSLAGFPAGNYVLDHIASDQGFLTVTPKPISVQLALAYNGHSLSATEWIFGDLELNYGFSHTGDGFSTSTSLTGVLEGDDVSLTVQRPFDLEWNTKGYLAVNEYAWRMTLEGKDGHNYTVNLEDMVRPLRIVPRPVELWIGADEIAYGASLSPSNFHIGFAGEDNRFFTSNYDLQISDSVIVQKIHGNYERSFVQLMNELPVRLPAGYYHISRTDEVAPVLVGADAKNFTVTRVSGGFEVQPRPLIFTPPIVSWIYGTLYHPSKLYSSIIGPDGHSGVLSGDDVSVTYWDFWGEGISENNQGAMLYPDYAFNPAGEYRGFNFNMAGEDAHNYTIKTPEYTVTIWPRPLHLPMEAEPRPFSSTYGDPLRPVAGRFGGYLGSSDLWIGVPGDDGALVPAHTADAGQYRLDTLGLIGTQAGNYTLETQYPSSFLTIHRRDIFFSIEDVVGQYGNFLGCLDPATCNGGPNGPHGANYLWVPGLSLGPIDLEGILPGDEVKGDAIVLIDANGRTGSLADVPRPGLYFQVLDGLTGRDAHNYRIAATGNRPGLLTITPQWVMWQTHNGIYMPETGALTLVDDWADGFVRGFVPTLKAGTNAHLLEPTFHFIRLNEYFEEVRLVDGRRLTPGNYTLAVEGFGGSLGANYQPVPRKLSGGEGILTVFADSRLGLELVGGIENPALRVPFAEDDRSGGVQSGSAGGSSTNAPTGSSGGPSDPAPLLGVRFGDEVDYTLLEFGAGRATAYSETLAQFGVTGVKLSAKSGVSVEYQIGPGYVEVGSEASAVARAGIGPTGAKAVADVKAGVSAGGGVEGSLGGGVSGEASGSVGAMARARAETGVTYENGRIRTKSQAQAGAGVTVGGNVGVSGDGYSVGAGATVYSPGIFAKDIQVDVGFSGGTLTLAGNIGAAVGIAGFGFEFNLSIDFNKVGEAFAALGCDLGISGCPPSLEQIGRGVSASGASMSDPVARFEYLANNPEWTAVGRAIQSGQNVPEDVRRAYDNNQAFFSRFSQMVQDVERYAAEQQAEQDRFFRMLEENPYHALMIAQGIAQDQEVYGGLAATRHLAESIEQQMIALGVRLVISDDGEINFGGRWDRWR